MHIIFDLDQTLIDSSCAEQHRTSRNWPGVYSQIPKFLLYEGIKTSLDYIKQNNIPYAIVTSSPSIYCHRVCQHWGFEPSCIIGYHDTANRKPHADPIKKAILILNARPNNTISFGDRDIDIIASNAANVTSVGCLWGASNKNSLLNANPSFSINSPLEIIQVIQNIVKL